MRTEIVDMNSEVLDLLNEVCLVPVESPGSDLIESGVLDSTTLIEVLLAIEERFQVSLPIEEIDIEDLRSVEAIEGLLLRSRGQAEHAA